MKISALIDKAATNLASNSALARNLGVQPGRVFAWRAGSRPCPLEVQVQLCDIAGLSDHETRVHLREVAGVQPPKRRATAILSAFTLLALAFMASAVAPRAEAAGLRPIGDNV